MDATLKKELTPLLEALKGDRNVSKSVRVAAEELLAAATIDYGLVGGQAAAKQDIPRRVNLSARDIKTDKS